MNGKIHGVQQVLYDSCLNFQISSLFPPFISLLKTTREAEVVTILPRFWFERDELQCAQQTVTNETSARIARDLLLLEPGENKKKRKKENLSEAVQIQFQTVQFFSFTSFQTNIPENFQSFPRAIYRIGKKKTLKL